MAAGNFFFGIIIHKGGKLAFASGWKHTDER